MYLKYNRNVLYIYAANIASILKRVFYKVDFIGSKVLFKCYSIKIVLNLFENEIKQKNYTINFFALWKR